MSKTRLPMKAWAIVIDGGKGQVDCWDSRLPIFWTRKIAELERDINCLDNTKVVPVIISAASKGK